MAECKKIGGRRRRASSRVMDGRGGGGSRGEKVALGGFCSICRIIMRCVSVRPGGDIIKQTQGRLGSPIHGGPAELRSILPLDLYRSPPVPACFEKSPLDPDCRGLKQLCPNRKAA